MSHYNNNNTTRNIPLELALTIRQICQDFTRNSQSVLGQLDPAIKEKAADIMLNELDDLLDELELIVNGILSGDISSENSDVDIQQ